MGIKTKWIPEVRHYCPDTPLLLVGLKADLRDSPEWTGPCVPYKAGEDLAKSIKAEAYYEVSALTQEGIHEMFDHSIRSALEPRRKRETSEPVPYYDVGLL